MAELKKKISDEEWDAAAPKAPVSTGKISDEEWDAAAPKSEATPSKPLLVGGINMSKWASDTGKAIGDEVQTAMKDPVQFAVNAPMQLGAGAQDAVESAVKGITGSKQSLFDDKDSQQIEADAATKFPISSGISHAVGGFAPTAMAQEAVVGPTIESAMLSLAQKSPQINALVQTAKQMPGALKMIGNIVNPGNPNVQLGFMGGVQEELGRSGQPGQKFDWGKAAQLGLERSAEFGAAGEAGDKIFGKISEMFGVSKAKQAVKEAEHQQKMGHEAQKAQQKQLILQNKNAVDTHGHFIKRSQNQMDAEVDASAQVKQDESKRVSEEEKRYKAEEKQRADIHKAEVDALNKRQNFEEAERQRRLKAANDAYINRTKTRNEQSKTETADASKLSLKRREADTAASEERAAKRQTEQKADDVAHAERTRHYKEEGDKAQKFRDEMRARHEEEKKPAPAEGDSTYASIQRSPEQMKRSEQAARVRDGDRDPTGHPVWRSAVTNPNEQLMPSSKLSLKDEQAVNQKKSSSERADHAEHVRATQHGQSNKTRSSANGLHSEEQDAAKEELRQQMQKSGMKDNEIKDILKNFGKTNMLFGGPEGPSVEALKFLWAKLQEKLPKNFSYGFDEFSKFMGEQYDMGILRQLDPALKEAMGKSEDGLAALGEGMEKLFKQTAGKLRFARGGGGGISPELVYKGLRGKLTEAEQTELPEKVLSALNESREHIDDFLQKTKPVLDWLEANKEDIKKGSDLDRMQRLLQGRVDQFSSLKTQKMGGLDEFILNMGENINKFMFLKRAKNASIHLGEKLAYLHGEAGAPVIGIGKAIVNSTKNGGYKDFADTFYHDISYGPVTEANEEGALQQWINKEGDKKPLSFKESGTSTAGKIIGAQPLEAAPQRVAATIALDKTAAKLGYASGEELGRDLVLAREGKGALAYNTDKTYEAMSEIDHFVNRTTGSNVPGFVNRNVLQRNKIVGVLNRFLTARIKQSHNLWEAGREAFTGETAGDKFMGAYKVGANLATLGVAGGAAAIVPREAQQLWRDHTPGGPVGYYQTMDAIRVMRHDLPSMPHLQVSVSPLISGGGDAAINSVRKAAQVLANNPDNEKKLNAVVQISGAIAASSMFKMGGGPFRDYITAFRDGMRGYDINHLYEHLMFGQEQHIADIPESTNVGKSLAKAYSGISFDDDRKAYDAEKAHYLRKFVTESNNPVLIKVGLKQESQMKKVFGLDAVEKLKDTKMAELKARGIKSGDKEWKDNLEKFTKLETKNDAGAKFQFARANMWQKLAEKANAQPKKEEPKELPHTIFTSTPAQES